MVCVWAESWEDRPVQPKHPEPLLRYPPLSEMLIFMMSFWSIVPVVSGHRYGRGRRGRSKKTWMTADRRELERKISCADLT